MVLGRHHALKHILSSHLCSPNLCHVTWEVTECVPFAHCTPYNPVWHLSVFVHCCVDGKNKPLHVVCKQVFKYKCMIKPAVVCEDFYYVLDFWLICGCGGNKDRHCRSAKSWQVIDAQWGDYKREYWRCVVWGFFDITGPIMCYVTSCVAHKTFV